VIITSTPGLPDFSWCKHAKTGKWPQSVPNVHKLYQMSVKYSKRDKN
jgi:hypothetical protein